MNDILRREIAHFFYKVVSENNLWGDPSVLLDEANGKSVSARQREINFRDSLSKVYDRVKAQGYNLFRDRNSFDVATVVTAVETAFMPYVLSEIPGIVAEIPTPWHSPRSTVKTIMAAVNRIRDEFIETDWPNTERNFGLNPKKSLHSAEEYSVDYGPPRTYFVTRLDWSIYHLQDWLERFFFEDPLELLAKGTAPELTTSDRMPTSVYPAPAPQHQRRADWLKARLLERGWNKHRLAENGGPDHKTVQKVLDGASVREEVLERIATALSRKRGFAHVAVTEIPLD